MLLKYENTVYYFIIDIISELLTQNIYIRKDKDKQLTTEKINNSNLTHLSILKKLIYSLKMNFQILN